jgi:two-component system, NtrC family, response regulator HydG
MFLLRVTDGGHVKKCLRILGRKPVSPIPIGFTGLVWPFGHPARVASPVFTRRRLGRGSTTLKDSSEAKKRVLLVDSDEAFATVLRRVLGEGYTLSQVASTEEATSLLCSDEVDVVLLYWGDGDSGDSRDLLKQAQELEPAPPVIVFSWDTRRETAMGAAQDGALDFFTQPLDVHALKFALDRAHRRMTLARDLAEARKLISTQPVDGLLGNSKSMQYVYDVVHKVAGVLTTVLITGESGTGKEVVARAIHRLSPRAQKPFVAFSACALPESLIEDELFGHEKGAFTGAAQSRRGRFEEAKGGTIFLDEIGDLALPLQAKLLRVLQERTLERLGSNAPVPVDVRVICATNRDLEKMVKEGTFRQDLYFRVSVVRVHIPPLRQRADDIPLLAEYFLRAFAKVHHKRARSLTPGFLGALAGYSWPGNVRELQNVIERSLVLANGNQQLGVNDLPPELKGLAIHDEVPRGSFDEAVRSFKREIIRSSLQLHKGNKLKAAQELHISRCYLHRLLKQLGIEQGPGTPGEEMALAAESMVAQGVQ